MKNAIILHGTDDTREDVFAAPNSLSNMHWFPWLQWELIKQGILTQTPEMPNPWDDQVNYDEWAMVFEQFPINQYSVLIGHSWGGGFLLKYLSQYPEIRIDQLVLVAPSINTEKCGDFMKGWNGDTKLADRIGHIDILYSVDDNKEIINSVKQIIKFFDVAKNFTVHKFENKGHFIQSRIGKEFPELLAVINH